MEIKPYKGGYAVYKDGRWCTWSQTKEWAEHWAKDLYYINAMPDKLMGAPKDQL